VPILAQHGINGESGRNYHLMDEDSTGGMVIQSGITNSWTRNLPGKRLFRWELPDHGREIHRRKGILHGFTSSITLIQTGKIKMHGNNSRISSSKSSILSISTFKKFKYETSLN
jgi:hypothetical protein